MSKHSIDDILHHLMVISTQTRTTEAQREYFTHAWRLLGLALEEGEEDARRQARYYLQAFVGMLVRKRTGSISMNAASRRYGVSRQLLWYWAQQGIIPILLKGQGRRSPTYLDMSAVEWAANLYHEAKRQGIQPMSLIKEHLGE